MRNSVIFKIIPKKEVMRCDRKIQLLGVSSKIKLEEFLSVRLILTILIFVVMIMGTKYGFILGPVLAVLFYIGIEWAFLDVKIKKRAHKLEKEALFFLEVLVLTLESGRNLRHAINLVTNNVDSEISLEFKRTLEDVKMGKSLNEALESMKKRIPSDTINNAILSMVQSNTFGNSIVDSMYNQIDFLRNKQMLDVKAEIAKLPTKISIISVIFFIPIMLLIILAPVLIQYIMK